MPLPHFTEVGELFKMISKMTRPIHLNLTLLLCLNVLTGIYVVQQETKAAEKVWKKMMVQPSSLYESSVYDM